MVDQLEEFRKQHQENYKKAIIDIIGNNTDVLVDEDIMSLLRKPPLDSMDLIKAKYLAVAKKNKIVLDTVKLDKMLDGYRSEVSSFCPEVKDIRKKMLQNIVSKFDFSKDTEVMKFNKKDFLEINKQLKRLIKNQLQLAVDEKIIKKVDTVFASEVDLKTKKKIVDEVTKFLKGNYQKQLLENIDFKILVKDTTLMNGVKEHGERYLFTINNSRIFK